MSKKTENVTFNCENCGEKVFPLTNGSFRNHCPYCLYSKHVDIFPGDRSNNCLGLMEPYELFFNSKKGYQIIHRCTKCNQDSKNIIAQNTIQEDNFKLISNIKTLDYSFT